MRVFGQLLGRVAVPWKHGAECPSAPVSLPQLHRDAADALVGKCVGDCRTWLDHTVSVHTHGRTMSDYATARTAVQRFLHTWAQLEGAGEPLAALTAHLRP